MDPAGLAIASWVVLQAWATWKFIKRFHSRRNARKVKYGSPSNYIWNRKSHTWIGGDRVPHHLDAPTLQERFDRAFYQAWIEPTMEIIDRIDAECAVEEPEPEHVCIPCDHVQVSDTEYTFRLEERVRMQQELIHSLEARLKEMADHAIEAHLMSAGPIDTKHIWR